MTTFQCKIPDCPATKHEGHGLCKRHYRASRPREADKPTEATCDGCGLLVLRYTKARYAITYCSELCRHWCQWGAWSKPVRKPRPPAKAHPLPREIECAWCGAAIITAHSLLRFCAASCARRAKHAARRGREHNAPGTYTWSEIARLWLTFDKACAYCSTSTPLGSIQAEHVVPLSRGGRNDLANLLPSCAMCNSDKRDLLLHEWNPDRARRHLTPVRTTWSDTDPRFRHLTLPTNSLAA